MAIAPVDTSSFSKDQLSAFNTANALGSGVQTINSKQLAPQAPLQLPATPSPADYSGVMANGSATIEANNKTLTPTDPTQGQDPFTSLFDKYLGSQTAPPSASQIYSNLYGQSGITGFQDSLNQASKFRKDAEAQLQATNAQLQGLAAESQAAQVAVTGQGGLQTQIGGREATIARQYAIRALPLQAQAFANQAQVAAAQGNEQLAQSILQQAQTHLDTAFQLQVQDATAQYNYRKEVLGKVYDFATGQEQRKVEALQRKEDKAFQVSMENLRFSHDQANTRLASSLRNDTLPTAGYNGEFAATIDLAANTGGTNQQRANIKNTLKALIANGDYKSAYAAIQQTTTQGLRGEAQKDFQNRTNQLQVTKDLSTALQKLQASGYNTNKLTGGFNQIQNTVGALIQDPQYTAAATELSAALQSYRLQMTGANFSATEARDYANVLPSAGNTFALNQAKIQGLQSFLTSTVDAYTKQVVGSGGQYIREYADGATQQPQAQANTDNSGRITNGLTSTGLSFTVTY